MKLLPCAVILSCALLSNADLVAPGETIQFFPQKDHTFCLVAASNTDGAAVTIASCASSSNTQWTVTQGSLATGTITMFGNKCLDVTNGVNGDGTKMQIFTCGNGDQNQLWQVDEDMTIRWAGTNKCLDNTGGMIVNGNPTQIFTCGTGNVNQEWFADIPDANGTPYVFSILFTLCPHSEHSNTPGGLVNFFKPRSSDMRADGCLTATSNANGAPVTFDSCNFAVGPGTHNTKWTLSAGAPASGTGHVGTIQIFGNKCLDVPNGSTANGVKLQIWTCGSGNANQMWVVNGDATITWSGKNKCVDLTNGNLTLGNPVQNWACSAGDTNQEWFILAGD